MEWLSEYFGEITTGAMITLLSSGVAAWKTLQTRIRKVEDEIMSLKGDLKLNTELDKMRNAKR